MFRNGFVFRLIGVLILIGLMAGGGYMAYRAGQVQGISQAPAVATAISQAAENGQAAPAPPMYGYGYGYGHGYPYAFGYPHHFGFFPFGICGSILFVFFFFALLRMIFRPWGWRHHGHHGPWGKWEGDVPPMFSEWHKRAHGETPTEEKE